MTQNEGQLRYLALIDDDDDFRTLVRRVAEPLGWSVSEYESGQAFLENSQQSPTPDLAFLDLMMPERDGIETIPDLSERYPECRIVIVTGGAPPIANAASLIGESVAKTQIRVLCKPVSISELRDALSPPTA